MKDSEISRLVRAAKRLIVDFARPRRIRQEDLAPMLGIGSRITTSTTLSSWLMCSWCHELNEVGKELSVYCWNCSHRFDVARAYCDCQGCHEEFQLAGGDA